jgi:DNA primase
MIKSYEENSNLTSEIFSRLEDKPEYVGYDESQVEDLHSTAMSSNVAISYYTNRKITEQSMKKFKLGFSEKRQMVTIPVHSPDGLLLGFVGRSVEGKEFKNTPNLPKAKTLFNLFRVKTSKNIYVVESSFDAIRLDQCGLPAVATLGSNVSNFQIDLLKKYFNDIIVIADNDDAGASMVKKLKKNLSSKLTVLSLDSKYKDVGDMGDDQIRALSTDFDKSIISMLQ